MTTPTASTISATLRRAGFLPVAPSDHHREGLKVKGSMGGSVRVYADIDSDAAARRMADDAADALVLRGFAVSEIQDAAFYVTRR